MKLTPLDIHHKEFNHAIRGYNDAEVDAFLDQVADELERLFKENIDLSEQITELREQLRGYQEMERALNNALLSAQKNADDLMLNTQREADLMLREAEVKAKEVFQQALASKQKATADLASVKKAAETFRSAFKATLESYLAELTEVPLDEDAKAILAEEEPRQGSVTAAPMFEAVPELEAVPAEPQVAPEVAVEPVLEPEPEEEPKPKPAAEKLAKAATASGLVMGELDQPDLDADATMEFKVAEFGFGERDDELDIEEID